MSVTLMSQVWGLAVSRERKLVLMALADHADDDGYCFPSAAYIAWKTEYSERQIQRILDELEKEKVILVAREHTPTTPRIYQLALGNAPKKAEYQRKPSGRGDIWRGDISEGRGDISATRGDTAVSPEPSVTISNHNSTVSAKTAAPPIEGGSVDYDKKLDQALGDTPKRHKFAPKTPLAKYLAENVSYGGKKWEGFVSAAQRKEWERLEQERYDDLKWAIDWAIPRNMPFLKLAGNIMTAAYKRKPDPKKEIPKEVIFSKDGGFYI